MVDFKKGYFYARAMHTSTFCTCLSLPVLQEDGIFMARFLHQDSEYPKRSQNHWILAFFWISGLISGILSAYAAGPSFLLLMRRTVFGSVSIVSLLCASFLPFLLSASAVFFSAEMLIFPIALVKGFLFSFVSMGAVLAFGFSGWFLRILICFADLMSVPLLLWFWLHSVNAEGRRVTSEGIFMAAFLLLIASIDYRVISPFLADLINL